MTINTVLNQSTLSHSEKEEKAPRVASYDCSRETRAGGEELAFPVASPIPSFLASPLPTPFVLYLRPSISPPPRRALRARQLPASFSL
jgi:hypothetical protein